MITPDYCLSMHCDSLEAALARVSELEAAMEPEPTISLCAWMDRISKTRGGPVEMM